MKVILSVDTIRFPLTGIGRYTYELARGLQQAGLNELLFMSGLRLDRALPSPPDPPVHAGTARLTAALRSRAHEAVRKSRIVGAVHGRLLPWRKGRALAGREDWVYHGPGFYLPRFSGPSVTTIHDLSVYLWPDTHPPERVRYMRHQIERALQQADFLITDTEYTRREVADYFNWPLERIRAVHLASAPEFRPRSGEQLYPALQSLGLKPGGYVLFASTVEPRKNLQLLLKAYSRLPMSLRQRWPLVVSGYSGWASADLHQQMDAAQRSGWLTYLGFVDSTLLPVLMAGARLFVYPSLYEGFGLPVVEAMASGVPVICSSASTLPEVAGGAAALHAPDDVDGLSALIQQGIEDDGWCAAFRARGLARAAQFSWQRCVSETLEVYAAARQVR